MKTTSIQEIFRWALAHNLHEATDGEREAWAGAEGTLYLAEDCTCTVVIDVTAEYIAIEVHNWSDANDCMTGLPDVQLHLSPTDLPML